MINFGVMQLLETARDRSRESRNQLMADITDAFLDGQESLNDHELALMTDILSKLVGEVEASVKKHLAVVLSESDVPLPEIARILANDDVEVARPLLKSSGLLTDPDLIQIVKDRTDEHRMVIALRDKVASDVSDALVQNSGEDVIEALLRNHNAELSRQAMEYLVSESRRVDRFQEPLLDRADLPSPLAYRMYWWVSSELRKRIVSDHRVDEAQFRTMIDRATTAALTEQSDLRGVAFKAQKLIKMMASSNELSRSFLVDALRQGRLPVFVAGIAHFAGIDYHTAWFVVNDRKCDSVAVLAKAAGMDRNDFATIHLLLTKILDGAEAKSPSLLIRILAQFDAVAEDTARRVIRFWQQDQCFAPEGRAAVPI